jgi:hypothetical protein
MSSTLADYREVANNIDNGAVSRTHKLSDGQLEAIETWARKIALQIAHGNRTAAHDLVDKGVAQMHALDRSPLLSTSLAEVGVPNRLANALERYLGVTTIDGLLGTPTGELLTIPSFGEASVFTLLSTLVQYLVKRILYMEALDRAE